MPFAADKTLEIFHTLLGGKEKFSKRDMKVFSVDMKQKNRDIDREEVIRKKIRFVGKMSKVFKTVKEE